MLLACPSFHDKINWPDLTNLNRLAVIPPGPLPHFHPLNPLLFKLISPKLLSELRLEDIDIFRFFFKFNKLYSLLNFPDAV
jgi:hypothetical protein